MAPGEVIVFGIRHHGPGSARSLRRALEELRPDIVLVEGPPEAGYLLSWADHPEMEPPVALLVYRPDAPRQAAYYPFAVFSPEWQAIQYALERDTPARFVDLPQAHQLALRPGPAEPLDPAPDPPEGVVDSPATLPAQVPQLLQLPSDPLSWIAEAAGYNDGERWWEQQVEQRLDGRHLFEAILELMAALRSEIERQAVQLGAEIPGWISPYEGQREAYMRQAIRAAQAEGFGRLAVVCGAWHAPALVNIEGHGARADEKLLKGLPKVKTAAAWVPWSYGRLAWRSGYGAGVASPGWYHHLWWAGAQGLPSPLIGVYWLVQSAGLFRQEDLDASSAQVIEAARLAECLAALREHPLPGLPELTEALQAVFFQGETLPLGLVHERLIVGERLGRVPDSIPSLPFQSDLAREQKRLRLPPEAGLRELDLDLRKPVDLERSYLLHRLMLLDIPWGMKQPVRGKSGTFHELWRLQWNPELAVKGVEASLWGNTVLDAAGGFARHKAEQSTDLPYLTGLTRVVLLAGLRAAIPHLVARLEAVAALAGDVGQLMDALAPLAEALRYGDVRQTDTGMLKRVLDGMLARICVGLPLACASLNDEAAGEMFAKLVKVQGALTLLQDEEYRDAWQATLAKMAAQPELHGLLAGRICRILLDEKALEPGEVSRRMGLALAFANPPSQASAWLEGFLKDGGALLIHDPALWGILDGWVTAQPAGRFVQALPVLRRTFATFTKPERRQMGERVKQGSPALATRQGELELDPARANAVLPLLAKLLGIETEMEN